MLEFEENRALRPKGGRPGGAFAFVVVVAVVAGLVAFFWARRQDGGKPMAADAPSEVRLLDSAGVDALCSILDGLPVSSVVADLETSALAEGRLGGGISTEVPARTVFGVEFRPLRQTAWVVASAGAERIVSLAREAGLALIVRPFSDNAAIVLPPPNLAFGESFLRTGIFIDYTREGDASVRFVPSDEWVESQTGSMDHPSVGQLERLALAAPDSVALLRYFASISNSKAASVVAARIRAVSPPMSGLSASFGGKVVWRGARLVHPKDGGPAGVRLYFSIPSKAAAVSRDCSFSIVFASVVGGTLAEDSFAFSPDDASVTSFKADSDGIDFSVLRPIPEAVAKSDVRWTLNLGVSEMTARGSRALHPEGDDVRIESGRVVVDGFE